MLWEESGLESQPSDGFSHMKYIDHFYQLVIKSILTYLTDVYGHEYMAND